MLSSDALLLSDFFSGVHLHARHVALLLRRLGGAVLRPERLQRPQVRMEVRRTDRRSGKYFLCLVLKQLFIVISCFKLYH